MYKQNVNDVLSGKNIIGINYGLYIIITVGIICIIGVISTLIYSKYKYIKNIIDYINLREL